MSEVMNVSGKVSVPHDHVKRGDAVRIVIDGTVQGYGERDTAHGGTEYLYTIRAEAGHLLRGAEYSQFDQQIAEIKAKHGEDDPRQGSLDDAEDDGDVLPLGKDAEAE